MPDAEYAEQVVAVTDGLVSVPLEYVSIPQTQVDYIVEVESIGDPSGIATGSIRISKNPAELVISKYVAEVIKYAGLLKEGIIFQFSCGIVGGYPEELLVLYRQKCSVLV